MKQVKRRIGVRHEGKGKLTPKKKKEVVCVSWLETNLQRSLIIYILENEPYLMYWLSVYSRSKLWLLMICNICNTNTKHAIQLHIDHKEKGYQNTTKEKGTGSEEVSWLSLL